MDHSHIADTLKQSLKESSFYGTHGIKFTDHNASQGALCADRGVTYGVASSEDDAIFFGRHKDQFYSAVVDICSGGAEFMNPTYGLDFVYNCVRAAGLHNLYGDQITEENLRLSEGNEMQIKDLYESLGIKHKGSVSPQRKEVDKNGGGHTVQYPKELLTGHHRAVEILSRISQIENIDELVVEKLLELKSGSKAQKEKVKRVENFGFANPFPIKNGKNEIPFKHLSECADLIFEEDVLTEIDVVVANKYVEYVKSLYRIFSASIQTSKSFEDAVHVVVGGNDVSVQCIGRVYTMKQILESDKSLELSSILSVSLNNFARNDEFPDTVNDVRSISVGVKDGKPLERQIHGGIPTIIVNGTAGDISLSPLQPLVSGVIVNKFKNDVYNYSSKLFDIEKSKEKIINGYMKSSVSLKKKKTTLSVKVEKAKIAVDKIKVRISDRSVTIHDVEEKIASGKGNVGALEKKLVKQQEMLEKDLVKVGEAEIKLSDLDVEHQKVKDELDDAIEAIKSIREERESALNDAKALWAYNRTGFVPVDKHLKKMNAGKNLNRSRMVSVRHKGGIKLNRRDQAIQLGGMFMLKDPSILKKMVNAITQIRKAEKITNRHKRTLKAISAAWAGRVMGRAMNEREIFQRKEVSEIEENVEIFLQRTTDSAWSARVAGIIFNNIRDQIVRSEGGHISELTSLESRLINETVKGKMNDKDWN